MIREQILLSLFLLLSISAFSQEMDPLYCSTAFLVGLGINVFAVVNACNGAAKVNFDRGYRSGINVRVAPYVGRNPDLMASSNSGGNNYGLSVNLEF